MLAMLTKLVPGKAYLWLAVAGVIGGQYLYGTYLKSGRDAAREELSQVKTELATIQYSYTAYQENVRMQVDTISTNLDTLRTQYGQAKERVDELELLYSRHDLGMLITRKPALMDKRFNDGTEALRLELEGLTGDFHGRSNP